MGLPSDLISQFVKVTNDKTKEKSESTQYGTIVEYNGSQYIRLDGSELLTPIKSTVSIKDGDRATVTIKNHTATVNGNLTDPAASSGTVNKIGAQISEFEIVIADKVSTQELESERARINDLVADNVVIKDTLTANKAEIEDLIAENVTINGILTANEAEFEKLRTTKLDASVADITYATIKELEATDAKINNLEATYGDFEVLTTNKFTAIDGVIDKLDTTYATIDNLNSEKARIDDLEAEDVVVKNKLTAHEATISTLESDNVTIKQQLTANNASIDDLEANKLDAATATITYATIVDLDTERARIGKVEAEVAEIDNLEAEVADINTLIFGSASGTSIQTSFANAIIAQLGNAQIKSAMIENVSADKITAGDIITNNVRVMSEDGKLLISDETIQISDNARVRVQIGKDSAGDYSINIWDADGKLMFSEGGITDNAIKEAIIRNDMVSDDANISAYKLDIDSLFSAINEDGSHTIKSSQIYLDDESQTLNVAFNQMTNKVTETTTTANTALSNASKAQSDIDNLEIGGRNFLKNSDVLYTRDNTASTNEIYSNSVYPKHLAKLVNKPISVSYYVHCIGDRQLGVVTNEHMANRFGAHLTVTWKDSTGVNTSNKVEYPFTKYLASTTNKARRSETLTLKPPTGYDTLYGVSLSTQLYAKPAVGNDEIWEIGYPKLELGNKATDWTPAPEDVDADISAAQETANTNAENIATLTQTVTSQGTELNVVQGQIASKIWQEDITTAVDGIEIGGRNLIRNSNFSKDLKYWITPGLSVNVVSDSKFSKVLEINSVVAGGGDNRLYQDTGVFAHVYNETYTLTFWAKAASDTAVISNVAAQHNVKTHNITTSWQRFTHTYTSAGTGSLTLWPKEANVDIYLANIKLELGNKVTDWTPAPEDMEADITNLSTKYSTLEQTVDGISTTVASHTTEISNKADQTTVMTVQNKVSELEQTVDGFQTTVKDTYATKTELNSLEIGGRNLIRQSASMNGTGSDWRWFINHPALITRSLLEGTDNVYKMLIKASGYTTPSYPQYRYEYGNPTNRTLRVGDVYTASIWYYADSSLTLADTETIFGFGAQIKNTSNTNISTTTAAIKQSNIVYDSWQKLEITFNITNEQSNHIYIVLYLYQNGNVAFTKPKLEKGNKATDWTPAPEDLESRVTTAETNINQNAQSITASAERITTNETDIANLKISADEISTRVSTNESNISNVRNDLDNLEIGGRNLLLKTSESLTEAEAEEFTATNLNRAYKYSPLIANDPKAFLLSLKNGKGLILSYDVNVPAAYKNTSVSLSRIGVYFTFNITKSDGTKKSWYGTHSGPYIPTNKHTYHQTNSLIGFGTNAAPYVGRYACYTIPSESSILKDFYANPDEYTVTAENAYAEMRGYTKGGYIKNIKLEVGTVSTEWTPAPEDIETRVTNAETSITQNAEQIVLRATKTELATVETDVNTLKTKVESNETAIEQNASAIELRATKTELGTVSSTASTALYNTKRMQDITNYSQLNDDTASTLGFTADSTADGHWYTMNTLARDKFISEYYNCVGNERFRISFEISTSVKGSTTNGGTDSEYRGTAIGLYCYDASGANSSIKYSNRVMATADAPVTAVTTEVTISSNARKFKVFVQTEGWGNFSGTLKIRNVRVEKIDKVLEAAIKVNSDSINAAVTRITDNEEAIANLEITADQISSTVSSNTTAISKAQNDIDNLEIGGTNLAEKTYSDWRDTNVGQWTGGIGYQVNGVDRWGKLTGFEELGLSVGDPCTISVDLNAINKSIKLRLDLYRGSTLGENYVSKYTETVIAGTSKRVSYTTTVTEEFPYFALYVANHDTGDTTTTTEQYKCLKIEKGNRATDWSPAPEDIQTEVDNLTTRVTTAETNITQNANSITAVATRVATNETAISELELTADGLTSRVSSSETLIDLVATLNLNAGKMLYRDPTFANSINSIGLYDNSKSGNVSISRDSKSTDNPMSNTDYEIICTNTGSASPGLGGFYWGNSSRANAVFVYRIIAKIPTGYTLTFASNEIGGTWAGRWLTSHSGTGKFTEYVYRVKCGVSGTFSSTGYFYLAGSNGTASSPVKWYIAYGTCFDMTGVSDTLQLYNDTVTNSQDITTTNTRIDNTETLIQQLSDCISTLVTDSSGQSLMTQTSTGWTFSMKSVNDTMTSLQNTISSLQSTTGSTQATVGKLQTAVNDLEDTAQYVRVKTYESEPCIELGESSSEFKLMITNTRIMFMKGSSTPTYIDTTGLVTENITINGELHHGAWVWKQRSNGNYGIQYVG